MFKLLFALRLTGKTISLALGCILMTGLSIDSLSQEVPLRREIARIIKYENPVDFNVVPGMLIGVMDADSTYRFEFGKDIYLHGVYELGSLTKPVLAWMVNKALDSLGLEKISSVCTFLPDSLCIQSWRNLTVDEVLGHRTGLPRFPPGIGEIETDIKDPYRRYTLNMLAHDLMVMDPSPGKYSYSHLGYAMTYWLFEKVGGLPAFTSAKLTGPFAMEHTKWDYENNEISPGYGLDGRPQPPWNTNALAPAMGLKSTLEDLITFIRLLFDDDERIRTIQLTKSLKKEIKAMNKTGEYKVVDGWFLLYSGKSLVFYHNGRTGGHHVSIAFTPQLRKGVVVISNGALGTNDLSLLILRMLRQAHPVD